MGLFDFLKKKSPTVTQEDKDWIEKNFIWLIEIFGTDLIKDRPFILPITEEFPYTDLKNTEQFDKLFKQLCKYWELDPNEIAVKFFDDFKSKQWSSYTPGEKLNQPLGIYYQNYSKEEKRFSIHLALSNLNNTQLLISVIAHELAHVKLLGGHYIRQDDSDIEPVTDLASIYHGFGLFVANSCEVKDAHWIGRSGYLPSQIISFANALLCYISGQSAEKFTPYLNTNTRSLFIQDYNFLTETHQTELNKEKVEQTNALYKSYKQIDEGINNRSFDTAIEACQQLLQIDPKNTAVLNSWGYALLLQKKYGEAITVFTRAIELDPHAEYPYNNRGYCKLQLNDLDNAYADIHISFEMNPDNSFAWRNLGAYYLKTNRLTEALEHFEKAETIDPHTELINFYLGQTHKNIGNQDKTIYYLNRSQELKEYNDSIIE